MSASSSRATSPPPPASPHKPSPNAYHYSPHPHPHPHPHAYPSHQQQQMHEMMMMQNYAPHYAAPPQHNPYFYSPQMVHHPAMHGAYAHQQMLMFMQQQQQQLYAAHNPHLHPQQNLYHHAPPPPPPHLYAPHNQHHPRIQDQGLGAGAGAGGYNFDVSLPWKSSMALRLDQLIARTYRASVQEYRSLLVALKYLTALLPMLTVLICYLVGMLLDHPFLQIPVPYLSYTGTDNPEKIIFSVGMGLSGLFFIPVLFSNQAGLLYLRTKNKAVHRLAYLGCLSAFLSGIFLILLAAFDVVRFGAIHYSFAITFFCTAFVWELCEASAHFLWYTEDRSNYQLRRAIVLKYFLVLIHAVAFIFFIILSASNECDSFMSIANYDACPSRHAGAAVSQYLCLGFILLYIATLSMTKYEDSILASQEYAEYNMRQRKQQLQQPRLSSSSSRHSAHAQEAHQDQDQDQDQEQQQQQQQQRRHHHPGSKRTSYLSQDSGEGSAASSSRSFTGLLPQDNNGVDLSDPQPETHVFAAPVISRRPSEMSSKRMDLSSIASHPSIPEELHTYQFPPRNIQPLAKTTRKSTNSFRSSYSVRSEFSDADTPVDDGAPLARRQQTLESQRRPLSVSSAEGYGYEPSAPPAMQEMTHRPSVSTKRAALDATFYDVKPF